MPVVNLPKEFFKKERQQLYSNWPVAFWRELVQNSVDAGAYTITIMITQNDGYVSVQFNDDGPGISRQVLEDVYFRLGATTKGGPLDSTRLGGFGRARILTCFSMLRYTIRTQNVAVVGEGADYSIETVEKRLKGCCLSIDIDDITQRDIEGALRVFLRQSQLGCSVVVNGQKWSEWAIRGAVVAQLTYENQLFATVYTNPLGLINHLIIRCRGIQSFFQISRAMTQVVIEIEAPVVRQVLTGNRDGMQLAYRSVLDKFLEKMILNSSTLDRQQIGDPLLHAGTAEFASTRLGGVPDISNPDVFVFTDFHEVDAKIVKTFFPFAMNSDKRQLMMVWLAACKHAIQGLIEVTRMEQINWSAGWIFSAPAKKAEIKRNGDLHAFCLNPLDRFYNLQYLSKNEADQRRLLAIAKHEAAHVRYLSHDEDFASLLTEIDAVVDAKLFFEEVSQVFSFEWTKDLYLTAFDLMRQGKKEDVLRQIPKVSSGILDRTFTNDAPNEDYFGEIAIKYSGEMTYLELWKIGYSLYGENNGTTATWKKCIQDRFHLRRGNIRWDDPKYLSLSDRNKLRDEWRIKNGDQSSNIAEPISTQELAAFQRLWNNDVDATLRFVITHTQINVRERHDVLSLSPTKCAMLRKAFATEQKLRLRNRRYEMVATALSHLPKRQSKKSDQKGAMEIRDKIEANGRLWFGDEWQMCFQSFSGWDARYLRDFISRRSEPPLEFEGMFLIMGQCLRGVDLNNKESIDIIRCRLHAETPRVPSLYGLTSE